MESGRLTESRCGNVPSIEACHWRTDPKIGRYFVPGCMGSAVYGESRCTCNRKAKATAADRIAALEDRVERLEAIIAGRSALSQNKGGEGNG